MRRELVNLVRERGVVRRAEALAVAPRHCLDYAVRTGRLVRLAPGTYTSSGAIDDATRKHAALRYAGDTGAISHLSALEVFGLVVPPSVSVHVTVPATSSARTRDGIVVHRRRDFRIGPPWTTERNGFSLVRLERAIVESWSMIDDPHRRRSPAIQSIGDRLTTVARLSETTLSAPVIKGRASLLALLHLLAEGCRSQLELWGYREIFDHPSLPRPILQLPVNLGGRTVYLDVAYEEELVDVELDGPQYHTGQGDRERDMLRDAALAERGWLPLRLTPARLRDADRVRADLAAILRRRREQLRLAPRP